MITSNSCWLKDECAKVNKDNSCLTEDKFCVKLFKMDQLYEQTLLTFDQRKKIPLRVDSDGTDSDSFAYLKSIVDNVEDFIRDGNNLYIYSSITGNGKTAWAVRFIQQHLNNIWYKCDLECKALFISVPRFIIEIKNDIDKKSEYIQHIKENVSKADIVVWDDLATKMSSQFEHDNLLYLIDSRMYQNKSNIFTSNIDPDNLYSYVGDRLGSRISNYSIKVPFYGKDKRSFRYQEVNV